ncbi:MAG: nucleotide exchange factor GrpE [Candidatus Thiosymbion ectosymbiont of Robbea hypermnestra]|nr:nucleotide exchange factor GrpE [Candidatus Thiosymbion ectosymbiont of Robbea hypermnestra]
MDAAAKDQLTARFRAYLDAPDPASATAADPADEPPPDLFTLLAEVAALKNEVKLESRHLKSALDEFRGLYATLREANTRLADEQARGREQEQRLEQQAQKELFLELLELRDRLQAGHDQARRFRAGRLAGRTAGRFITSMAEGIAMNLRRLDETLARRDVRPLAALEQTFNPHTMHATEVAHDPDRDPGLVVGELRRGFTYRDKLLRSAEVVVNRSAEE